MNVISLIYFIFPYSRHFFQVHYHTFVSKPIILVIMRLNNDLLTAAFISLIFLSSSAFGAFNDVFKIKPGPAETGGCDGHADSIPGLYDEAVKIIDAAVEAFSQYSTDAQVRKLALAFFNIQMNDAMTGTRDNANHDLLSDVQSN